MLPSRLVRLARRFPILVFLSCTALAAMAQAGPGAPPGAATFFQDDAVSDARLSPNGRFVAVLVTPKGGTRRLLVFDAATLASTLVAGYSNADVGVFDWVNDERLMYTLTNIDIPRDDVGPGLYAVDRSGRQRATLAEVVERRRSFFNQSAPDPEGSASYLGRAGLHGFPRRHDNQMLVVQADADFNLASIDTRTGLQRDAGAPPDSFDWLVDADGKVRVARAGKGIQGDVVYKAPASAEWRKLAGLGSDSLDPVLPLLHSEGQLYVSAHNGRDTSALYRYDIATGKLDALPLVDAPGYDATGHVITGERKMLGYRFHTDAEVVVWFDPAMKAVQAMADTLLPATINRIKPGARSETPFVVIDAYSDVDPHTYFLLNTDTKKLSSLGSANPDIERSAMSPMDLVRYKARDGLEIPAYLTLPKNTGKKNLPLVVLAPDLPWERAGWHFDPEVQFLASRGYAVLQPMARGSAGFGLRHFKAGHKQWGAGMQTDIADGARWAIAQGYADPKRMCIAGTGYGGYAALMGLASDPGLFKCGINRAGITDIGKMFDDKWTDFPERWKPHLIPLLVGDPVRDAAQLKAVSPLALAARITQPLLMAYGEQDAQVPFKHGAALRDALKGVNPALEWIAYDTASEAPLRPYQENRIDFWTRAEKFLERHIGTPAP